MSEGDSRPTVAIVMLTMNQRDKTLRALQSVREDSPSVPVVLWDNGSTDGTLDAVTHGFPDVRSHRHPSNVGVASGRNAAARLAVSAFQPTHLLFLDNDLVLKPGFTAALLEPFADERVGQTQAKLLYLHDPKRINDGGGCRINFWLGRTDPVGFREIDRGQCDAMAPCVSCGGAMMVRADVFERLGGFDSLFDPFGPEDIDFSLRLQAAGYRALYVPGALAYHEVSHSFEGGDYTATYAHAKARHWLRFLRRHGSPLQQAGFLLVGAPLIALRMVFRELARGNPGALTGSARGLIQAVRDWRGARN
ncbi:MAG TPA: glycosyltransferase family 2 protein [Steroidobacteraceae bacterium]|nr:glycosyltransferase family 2 protein [Steroidobacteraceae bacterium]